MHVKVIAAAVLVVGLIGAAGIGWASLGGAGSSPPVSAPDTVERGGCIKNCG